MNVPKADDHYCGNGADASGTSAVTTPGLRTPKTDGNTVYPMVGVTAHFSTGGGPTAKVRLWDVLNRSSSTKLNTTSGTGH